MRPDYDQLRREHEENNPARSEDVFDLYGVPHWREKGVTPHNMYQLMGFADDSPHPMDQMELPGMESLQSARKSGLMDATPKRGVEQRDTLPDIPDIGMPLKGQQQRVAEYAEERGVETPTHVRGGDIHPDDRADILARAATFGVTIESMKRAFGAQLDQANVRARSRGASEPAGARFYSGYDGDNPDHVNAVDARGELRRQAEEQGVHFQTMADAVALGSPRMAFYDEEHEDFPNVVGAAEYLRRGLAGDENPTSQPVTRPGVNRKDGEPAKIAMLPDRGRLIAQAAPQLEHEGKLSDELTTPKGKGMFGEDGQEKISAFGPAFKNPHGSRAFLVSDTHTAGGGLVPHIAHHTYPKFNEDGSPLLDKNGKHVHGKSFDEYMSIPGIHQIHDEVVRDVLRERGQASVHTAQAAQWGEERIQAGETTEEASYRGPKKRQVADTRIGQQFGQMEL